METLAQYVARIIKEKNLKVIDVQKRSGGKIADSYVTKILRGQSKNLTIEKAQALAKGLGVDEDELFSIARRTEPAVTLQAHGLLDLMKKILESPDLTAILKAIVSLKPAKIKALRKQLEKE